MRRPPAAAGLALLVSLVAAGCAGREPGTTNGDCAVVVRREGHDYADGGFVRQRFRRVGTAEVADCRDSGPGALGPTFGDDPHLTDVSSVGDVDPSLAVGVQDSPGDARLRVLVRLDAPADQVDAVMASLAR